MSIKKNYQFNTLQSIVNLIFPIITFPYAARIISPEGIGHTQFIFSFAQFFAFLAGFGIPIYGVKVISENRHNVRALSERTSELLLFGLGFSLIFTGAYLVSCSYLPQFFSNPLEIGIAALLILLSVLNVDWFFSGLEAFKFMALRSIVIKIIGVLLLFLWVKTPQDVLYYLLFLVFIHVGNYLFNFSYLLQKVRLTIRGLQFRRHLKPLVLIFSMAFATMLYTTLDTVILGFLTSNYDVGLYTASVKLTKVAIPVLTSLGVVVIPRASFLVQQEDWKALEKLYVKSFTFIVFLSIPMSIGIFLLRHELIYLFSGVEFALAAESMSILAFLPIMIGLGHFVAFQILLPMNKNWGMFTATLIGLGVFTFMSFMLIPQRGSVGAAIANISTELMVTAIYFMFVPRLLLLSLPWIKILKAFLSAIWFVPIIYGLQYFFLADAISIVVLGILASIAIYLLLQYYVFKEVIITEMIKMIVDARPFK